MSASPPGGVAARFVGQRVPRKEDRRLLVGRGLYVDDVVLAGMLEAAFVRSPHARARIKSLDLEAARALPGVRAVYTAADFAHFGLDLFNSFAGRGSGPTVRTLADGHVRYVGDPVAIVVADNRYIAEDGAGLVMVDYEAEDPVVTIAQARDGAPVHDGYTDNVGVAAATPDDPEIAAIFASAKHVVTGTIRHQRQAHVSMETRGIVVAPHGEGELTLHLSCQSPHMAARYVSLLFDLPETSVKVLSKDVGGAFGLKIQPWREEVAAIAASLKLRRPVKWIEDRLENLTSASQAREQEITIKLALDAEGLLLAADLDYACNVGCYPHSNDCNTFAMMLFTGAYRVPKLAYRAVSYYSNTVGQAAYRGPWAMESLARETMMDVAARQIGIDPLVLRERNLMTAADQPYAMPSGMVVHGVTPCETLELALAKVDVPAFRAEQARGRAEGRYLGLGVAVYVEPTTMAMGGPFSTDSAHVRLDPSGKVSVVVSTHSQGHGTQTTMAQIAADQLGVDVADVTVLEDDSSRGGFGPGAGGSRQAVSGGGAVSHASRILADKVKAIAAHMHNANPADIRIEGGQISVAGVAEVSTTVQAIAEAAYFTLDRLPPGMEPGMEAQYRYRPPPIVFSNAAHACVCEVSAETGVVKILRWIASEDCGVMINPAIVEGQIAGGVVQGIGGVLLEEIAYDAYGNPTAVTFKDYMIPTIHDVPEIEYCHIITPSDSEGGFKGVGEGGAIIAPPTMVNAIADALAPFGARCLDLPLTPTKILELIEAGEKG